MGVGAIFDIVGALALTALLAESYGMIRRKLVGNSLAPVVLGVLFGVTALVHMFQPLEPFDGLIIDMRNVPIALAGAFLGWRGLVPCLAIAMATRIGIGGVGMEAGLAGMVVAGGAGMVWAKKVHKSKSYAGVRLFLLALMMSAHQVTAILLPRELALWFLTNAAGPILAMNLICVPLIAALLLRENRRMQKEERLQAAISHDPASGLLLASAFKRDATQAFASKPMGTFGGFLVVDPVSGFWGTAKGMLNETPAVALDRQAFANLVEFPELVGISESGRIIVPLSTEEVHDISRLKGAVRSALRDSPFARAGHLADISLIEAALPDEFMEVVKAIRRTGQKKATKNVVPEMSGASDIQRPSPLKTARVFDQAQHGGLFAKADFLLERKNKYAL